MQRFCTGQLSFFFVFWGFFKANPSVEPADEESHCGGGDLKSSPPRWNWKHFWIFLALSSRLKRKEKKKNFGKRSQRSTRVACVTEGGKEKVYCIDDVLPTKKVEKNAKKILKKMYFSL